MSWPIIEKPRQGWAVAPNLREYITTRNAFTWEAAERMLSGLPHGGGLNIAHEAVDRHAAGARAGRTAIRWHGRDGQRRDLTYADLARATSRFANVLRHLDIKPGERVFSLAGRIPELYIAALGTMKARSVFCPLFSAFGPEPIQERMALGEGCVLVTTAQLYRRKVAAIRRRLPHLRHVLIIDAGEALPEETLDLASLMASASDRFTIEPTKSEEPALVHFTSGTTGKPKGAVHVHGAVVSHYATGLYALDLHDQDVYWCTADPGWVTGTSYGIIAPLTHGITMIVDEGDFDADRWYSLIEDERVSVWYTAPTALRMLMKVGPEAAGEHDLSSLRFVASVGEPLNPEAVVWGKEALGLPIHDNWWQTETGGIMIANFAATDIQPGSMGLPVPGVEAAVLARDAHGRVLVRGGSARVVPPGVEGELALRPGWPSMFRAYLHNPAQYRKCFVAGWYLTGDLVRRDERGYFWFVGRGDDVIKSAGHLIGPFEVESALMEHPAVTEAGVIGKPDPVAGEVVKAFVSLRPTYPPTEDLRMELLGFGRARLGAAIAPKEISFDTNLPKTKSGKILRRVLKARELGLPEGDLSTLEES